MEVEKSSHGNRQRSCFTQTSCLGEESHSGEDSQLEYLSAQEEYADDKNGSSEFSEQGEIGKVKDVRLSDEVPPHTTAGQEEVSGKSNRGVHSVSGKQEGQRGPAVAPEIPTSKNPGLDMEAADGSSPSCVKSEHRGTLRSAGVCAVSDSSDSRPCLPTSTAQACLCSRAINTEITMMNKSQACVDTASNTEWSFGAQGSHIQEQWESKSQLCPCDWKLSTGRSGHLDKQTVKNCVSSCCQKTLQRATEAELQLLAIHHKMCYQHCLAVYELASKENSCFGRRAEKAELYSSLLLVLEELEKTYNSMRMEINTGKPLNALPPLSVEVKLPPVSSFYVPCELLRKSLCSDGLSGEEKADFEASKLQEKETCVTLDKAQTDAGQPRDSASPHTREEQRKDQDLKRGRVKTEEGTESWFDAKEDLTLSDFSVIAEETKKQQEKQGSADLRDGKTVERGSEHPCVRVGGPSSSVPEDTGEDSLQKTSAAFSINSGDIFESPYALNLSSFSKLIKRLQARHPEASRDRIVEALQQVRENNKGMLCGLSISTIEERTSAILRKSVPSCGQEKQ